MKIRTKTGPCGAGKTHSELVRAVSTPALYILAVDRRQAIQERVAELGALAAAAGTRPHITVLCAPGDGVHLIGLPPCVEVANAARRGGVIAAISALPVERADYDHLIVLVTHEGLSLSDLSGFGGWHLIIDEAPNAWESGSERSPALVRHLEAGYTLQPWQKTGWSRVLVRDDELSLSAIRSDETLHRWASFHKRAQSRRGLLASVTDWSEVTLGRWSWWSLWQPCELAAFETVTVCAHAFPESVTGRLWASLWPEIEWDEVLTPGARTWTPRRVLIRYVTDHLAGSYWWSSQEGRRCLIAWTGWIASEYPEEAGMPHLRACNEANRSLLSGARISGAHPTIRVAGSNAYSDIHDVSVAYSGKPNPHEAKLLDSLGVPSEQIIRAREHEDLVQFVMRSSLRDPQSAANVRVNLYDREQADVVAEYLRRHYPFEVTVEHHEIGISDVEKPRRGRPPVVMTDAQLAENKQKRRLTKTALQRKRRAAARNAKAKVVS